MREFFLKNDRDEFYRGYGPDIWVPTASEADAMTLKNARDTQLRRIGFIPRCHVFPPALPTITLSPDDVQKVVMETKVLTVRLGLRDYGLGDAQLHDRESGIIIPITILRTSHCLLRHVPLVDLSMCGHASHEAHRDELAEFYPNISLDDPVTLVRFEKRDE